MSTPLFSVTFGIVLTRRFPPEPAVRGLCPRAAVDGHRQYGTRAPVTKENIDEHPTSSSLGIRGFWGAHRRLYRWTGGRTGSGGPKRDGWGTLRLVTIGRRTGLERSVILGDIEDGPNLVTMAMNGCCEGEPVWWLNLQNHPEVRADLPDGPGLVTGRAASGEERDRLWSRWRAITPNLDAFAARRPTETAVVVLEPVPEIGGVRANGGNGHVEP